MTKEELKALGVTDEAADKIVEDYGKNYVSKAQFNATNEEKKAAKTELAQIKTELDGLKEKAKGNEDLSKQIEDLKKQSEAREQEYTQKVKNMEIDGIVDRALLTAKAKSVKAVRALLDLNGAEVEDGKIKGLDKQIEKLVTEAGYLFGDDKTEQAIRKNDSQIQSAARVKLDRTVVTVDEERQKVDVYKINLRNNHKIKAGGTYIDGKPYLSIGYQAGRIEGIMHTDGTGVQGGTVLYTIKEW